MKTPSPFEVIYTMRRLKKDQVSSSFMDKEVLNYIWDNDLMRHTLWPGWVISYTEAGIEYLREHSEE